jgi:rubrerythrin
MGDEDLSRDVGDPVCWLQFVCQKCGQMREDAALDHCPNCGAAVDENSPNPDPVAH